MANSPIEYSIAFPFKFDGNGNVVKTSDQNKLWEDRVLQAIGTLISERVMRPSYGTKIPNSLFSTRSEMEQSIKKEVTAAFLNYLTSLSLQDVQFDYDYETGVRSANLTYSLPNQTVVTTSVGLVLINKTNLPYEESK
jgi:phage baseplate assembly protein W